MATLRKCVRCSKGTEFQGYVTTATPDVVDDCVSGHLCKHCYKGLMQYLSPVEHDTFEYLFSDKYTLWASSLTDVTGKCIEVTKEMVTYFPELTQVRGMVVAPYDNKRREHWWCVTSDGSIVDPTAIQFGPDTAGLTYYPVDESRTPSGKCPNCGDVCYDGDSICSKTCETAYIAYLNNGGL